MATTVKTVRKLTRRQLARRIVTEIRNHPANREHPNRAVARAVAFQVRKRLGRGPMRVKAYGLDLELPRTSGSLSNLAYFGEAFEWETINFVRAYLRPGDAVADVGANVGLFAYACLERIGPEGVVHCFEPLPWCVEAIERCAERNRLGARLDVRRAAASDEVGAARFDADLDVSSHLRWESTPSASRHTIEVQTVTLDNVLPSGTLALAKLDVEGAETRALRGFVDHLSVGNPPVLLLEAHDHSLRKLGSSRRDVLDLLAAHGYVPLQYDVDRRTLEPWAESDSDFVAVRADARPWVDERLVGR